MDEDEEYAETRDELLNRFRKSLSLPMAERFVDEDDLIEIFDYAGDLNDDFLRIEALMCGARFYPDSEALMVRRGIFYSQLSDEARAQFFSYNSSKDNLILEILKLRNNLPVGDMAVAKLDEFLNGVSSLADEEIIQLVDLASSMNQVEWLKTNMPRLREKVKFINVLLYEVAIVAEMAQDFEYSASLFEELTDIEPFNSYYWMLLSRQYAQMEDGERALSAIDYSLAINPQAYASMLVKAKLLYSLEYPLTEVLDLMKEAIEVSRGDVDCIRFLSQVYHNESQNEMACEIIESVLNNPSQYLDDSNPEISVETWRKQMICELVPDLVIYESKNIDFWLDQFYMANEENTQLMWMSWAQQLSMQGNTKMAKCVVQCYERNTGYSLQSLFTLEEEFTSGNFSETIKKIEDYLKSVGGQEINFPDMVIMHILALVKMGEYEKAYALCDFFAKEIKISMYQSVSNKLEYLGLMKIIKDMMKHIKNNVDLDFWNSYDPLGLWDTSDHQ